MFDDPQTKHLKSNEWIDALRELGPDDFNGHTEFHRMTAQQRLAWLDDAVAFIRDAKNIKSHPQNVNSTTKSKPPARK